MTWRDRLRPASFRGVPFKVDVASKAGGRRGFNFEYPKRDTPSDEDMGRRARRYAFSGWVIGPNYQIDADALEVALNAEGPGRLVHPDFAEDMVRCEVYTRAQRRTEGGMAFFDFTFVEAGTSPAQLVTEATQPAAKKAAAATSDAAAKQLDDEIVST
ncbi:DNA circularization N-terminal domain-containing protein [Chelatococcus reniformis]|jgi:prophage DNA circulation protein|uniref:DNA circulation N-terminal domain-containing protein n=1 Tax=Chelatococcus reniformis TaxID=1494448 RepID=A0A916XFM1_9HYPH|nr:DNA circularization N-terminal domain-containing protein [Chelatococcus reniformis]GGC68602.1 hypothetical protein GCM10010994_28990 [Chelatococcus reniformis]